MAAIIATVRALIQELNEPKQKAQKRCVNVYSALPVACLKQGATSMETDGKSILRVDLEKSNLKKLLGTSSMNVPFLMDHLAMMVYVRGGPNCGKSFFAHWFAMEYLQVSKRMASEQVGVWLSDKHEDLVISQHMQFTRNSGICTEVGWDLISSLPFHAKVMSPRDERTTPFYLGWSVRRQSLQDSFEALDTIAKKRGFVAGRIVETSAHDSPEEALALLSTVRCMPGISIFVNSIYNSRLDRLLFDAATMVFDLADDRILMTKNSMGPKPAHASSFLFDSTGFVLAKICES